MKILLLGSGGREHALADALTRENTPVELIAAPGNPGIAELARLVRVNANDPREVAALAEAEQVTLVVVGPEAPLASAASRRSAPRWAPRRWKRARPTRRRS
jgi:phosphoribosylamine--glycine ligase